MFIPWLSNSFNWIVWFDHARSYYYLTIMFKPACWNMFLVFKFTLSVQSFSPSAAMPVHAMVKRVTLTMVIHGCLCYSMFSFCIEHAWSCYIPISIKVAPVNYVSWPAVHYGKPFCGGKFSLVHVHWNNGDHLCEGVQDSFQLKWLRKFLSMSELKNFIFKISQ